MAKSDGLFVVGVGASAGGIEAFEGLFHPMPPDSGLAFVIVAHLAPASVQHAGRDPRPLHRHAGGAGAGTGIVVEADHVYVIPPDNSLTIERGQPQRCSRSRARSAPRPDRHVLQRLAEDLGEHASASCCRAAAATAPLGIKAIKEHGGLTLAQGIDHSAPRHGSMPSSAIATGLVDLVLPVEAMAGQLVDYVRSFVPTERAAADDLPGQPTASAPRPRRRRSTRSCAARSATISPATRRRRSCAACSGACRSCSSATSTPISTACAQDPEEVDAAVPRPADRRHQFFRDADAFAALAAVVIPKLFEGKGADDTVRVWVPGCATGEEVYLDRDPAARAHGQAARACPRCRCSRTDIDEAALAIARAGRYPASAARRRLARAAAAVLHRATAAAIVLAKEVRDLCIFSAHSVIRDPPFSRIDLDRCRNLLIYLGADLQANGHPDLPLRAAARRLPVPRHLGERVAARRSVRSGRQEAAASSGGATMPSAPASCRCCWSRRAAARAARTRRARRRGPGRCRCAARSRARVLERFAPAHVVVNRDGDMVYYSARTGKYLEAAPGQPSRQLLSAGPQGLAARSARALQEAVETGSAVTRGTMSRRDRGARAADQPHGRAPAATATAIRCSWSCSPISGRR